MSRNLPQLLDQLTQQQREEIIFQHDGAPPPPILPMTDNYPTCIGRGGTIWLGHPDLNTLDYFVWGFMKREVYKTIIRNEENLRNRVVDAANTLIIGKGYGKKTLSKLCD